MPERLDGLALTGKVGYACRVEWCEGISRDLNSIFFSNRTYMGALLMKLSANALVLIILSVVIFLGPLKAASKTPKAANVVQLDTKHSIALWNFLTKTEVTENELVGYFTNQTFTDEFDKRKKIRNAKLEYAECLTAVAGAKTFQINVLKTLGAYDFDEQAFPLGLYEGNGTYVLPWYGRGPTTQFVYKEGDRRQGGRYDLNNHNIRIWFNVLDGMRSIKVREEAAEKIQPRLNKLNNSVVMTLFLKTVSAKLEKGAVGFNKLDETVFFKNIYFEVTKYSVKIPATRGSAPAESQVEEIILKSSAAEKNRPGVAPNLDGVWVGNIELPNEFGGRSSHLTMEIEQWRSALSGTFRFEWHSEDISDIHGAISPEGDLTIGAVSRSGTGQFTLKGHLAGNSIRGNFMGFNTGTFSLTRDSLRKSNAEESGMNNSQSLAPDAQTEATDASGITPQRRENLNTNEVAPNPFHGPFLTMAWDKAIDYCNRNGGRLPTAKELKKIRKAECAGKPHSDVCRKYFMSSEEGDEDGNANMVKGVNFEDGQISYFSKILTSINVRCVE